MNIYPGDDSPKSRANIEDFRNVVAEFPYLKFFQPNPTMSPWHWQVRLERKDGAPVFINFWPHVGAAQRQGQGTVRTYTPIIQLIEQVLDEIDS